MRYVLNILMFCNLLIFAYSCAAEVDESVTSLCRYAKYFDLIEVTTEDSIINSAIVSISPYTGFRDTVILESPMTDLVCMSSSQVAGLSAIGADSVIKGVSGLRYISNSAIRDRGEAASDNPLYDIGYEAALDYEQIMTIDPDLVLTYTVSGAEPQFVARLRSLGIRVMVLYDHLEEHPLARAEYLRLYGAMTGRSDMADSLFSAVCERYDSLAALAAGRNEKVRVLMNVPYGDAWYVPGGDSYMSRLIEDAGGSVLGARSGQSTSGIIRLEQAYELSLQADIWLNPGPCNSLNELEAYHHSFHLFGPLKNGLPVYNNTLRMTPEGGNDFWESGSVRPDLILEDLINIFNCTGDSLEYHFQVK